ncbi:MAG: uroporphyrinogen decarboxylase [Acidobacteria bacterium]|nr:uroporphyrinogen decarboxylase [Acidobacteriota bacterium]
MSHPFLAALEGRVQAVPPIWCMRQAGRYQRAYQQFRQQHSFETLCREPELAAQVAMASIDDFDFDAAILFSDLLFPLDALGLPVRYDDGRPVVTRRLTADTIGELRDVDAAAAALAFQSEAVAALRRRLPGEKGLIGFVGAPWTLFVYAVEGTHAGSLVIAKSSRALYRRFAPIVVELLERAIGAQLAAGADLVMVFDTAAGELSPPAFRHLLLPDLRRLADRFPGRLGYYARGLHPAHLEHSMARPSTAWAGLGVDWRWNVPDVLASDADRGFIQGNFDPALLQLTGSDLRQAIDEFLEPFAQLEPEARAGWICGLGHGVLPGTPEESVKTFVQTVRRRLS